MKADKSKDKVLEKNHKEVPDSAEDKKKQNDFLDQCLQKYTGANFIPYTDLVEIVKTYQSKEKAEDVDLIEKKGGINLILKQLKTSSVNGIQSNSIEDRKSAYGSNEPPATKIKGFCSLFLEALSDLTLIILMIAAVISITINMITEEEKYLAWIEGTAILFAVFISAGVAAFQDAQKEKQFAELDQIANGKKHSIVIRDGKTIEIHPSQLVVGDLVKVEAGHQIAGDALLISGSSVTCDEAAMTGESDPLEKDSQDSSLKLKNKLITAGKYNKSSKHDFTSPVLLSGTSFQNGNGFMVVIAVGDVSLMGQIRATIQDREDEDTPLQKKLHKIANDIGYFGLFAAVVTILIMVGRATYTMITEDRYFQKTEVNIIIQGLLIGITVLVVAIPEGLPLAVTISLAFSVKKMLQDENLVRKFHACETMGNATYICSDKTGTLTLNQMYMVKFWNIGDHETYEEKIKGKDQNGKPKHIRIPLEYSKWVSSKSKSIFEIAMTANSMTDPKKDDGNPTDLAITRYMYLNGRGVDAVEMRARYPKVEEEPFNSDRKRMSAFLKDDSGNPVIVMKGASELVLDCCSSMLDLKGGETVPLTASTKHVIENAINTYATQALRTIALCYKYSDSYDKHNKDKNGVLHDESSGFTLIGIAGIRDVIRPEVPGAVLHCRKAGIQVKMVTGDNQVTAKAIAMDCNIIERNVEIPDNTVMLGSEFYDFVGGYVVDTDPNNPDKKNYRVKHLDKFKQIYNVVKVLARSRPEDKLTMVVGLKELGKVVAVTGDGTNDAPALSKADVGFAMGIAGTDIAKQAADILLTQDNFVAIVSAVKWGRNIYDSIRKFLQFQLTVNVVAVFITFISAAITQQSVLSPIQMLWVNLIMDTLASLALATEPPTDKLLDRLPNRPDEYIISKVRE